MNIRDFISAKKHIYNKKQNTMDIPQYVWAWEEQILIVVQPVKCVNVVYLYYMVIPHLRPPCEEATKRSKIILYVHIMCI